MMINYYLNNLSYKVKEIQKCFKINILNNYSKKKCNKISLFKN